MELARRILDILETYNYEDTKDYHYEDLGDVLYVMDENPKAVITVLTEIIERIGEEG